MQPAWFLWAVYSGHILGVNIEDAEEKFEQLSQLEQEAWVAVALTVNPSE